MVPWHKFLTKNVPLPLFRWGQPYNCITSKVKSSFCLTCRSRILHFIRVWARIPKKTSSVGHQQPNGPGSLALNPLLGHSHLAAMHLSFSEDVCVTQLDLIPDRSLLLLEPHPYPIVVLYTIFSIGAIFCCLVLFFVLNSNSWNQMMKLR